MKKTLQLLGLLLVLTYSSLYAQNTLHYRVLKDGKPIGSMKVQEFKQQNRTQYLLDYDMTLTFVFSVDISFSLQCIYEGGKLIHASTKSERDGKIREKTQLEWEGNYYKLIKDDHPSIVQSPLQQYSTTSMYFSEPLGYYKVFSERHGEHLNIHKMGDGKYEMILKGGNKNYYTYQNGICTLLTVSHTLGSVDFQLISN